MACVCNEHAAGPEVAIAEFSYLAAVSFMGMMRISRLRVRLEVKVTRFIPWRKSNIPRWDHFPHPLPFQQWCKVDQVHAIDTPS